jgi:hypothetical protein
MAHTFDEVCARVRAALRPFDPARRGRACAAIAMPDDAPAVTRDRLRGRMNGRRMSSASHSQPSPGLEAGRQRALQRSWCRKRPASTTERRWVKPRSWTRRAKTCRDRGASGPDGATGTFDSKRRSGGLLYVSAVRDGTPDCGETGRISALSAIGRAAAPATGVWTGGWILRPHSIPVFIGVCGLVENGMDCEKWVVRTGAER